MLLVIAPAIATPIDLATGLFMMVSKVDFFEDDRFLRVAGFKSSFFSNSSCFLAATRNLQPATCNLQPATCNFSAYKFTLFTQYYEKPDFFNIIVLIF